jgi:hypothetical protein
MGQVRVIEKVSYEQFAADSGRRALRPSDVLEGKVWADPRTLVECIHCGKVFPLSDVMLDMEDGLMVCPIRNCDGGLRDWMPL